MQKIKELLKVTALNQKLVIKTDSGKSPACNSRGTAATFCVRITRKRRVMQILVRMTER